MVQSNYKKFLDVISHIDKSKKPKLLLHVCCAPCSTACLELLNQYFDITVFYYNPNISPFEEYQKRLAEEQKFVFNCYPNIKVVEIGYDGEKFEKLAVGLEDVPEGGARCKRCYRLRLSKTAEYAKQNGFDYFTTTLTVSPYKNSDALNEIGEELAKHLGINYLTSDFKKNDGYKRSIELSKDFGLYRQDYCGCKYSKEARQNRIQLKKEI